MIWLLRLQRIIRRGWRHRAGNGKRGESIRLRLLCSQHRLPSGLGSARRLFRALGFGCLGCLGLFMSATTLILDGLLDVLASRLPGLRPRSRKIPVLGAMQIGPGV